MANERVNSALDPAELIAEARRAFFVMFAFLCVIWLVQVANWHEDYRLSLRDGIVAHQVGRLPDVFLAPFLHASWEHLEGNSGPLFVFGFLAAYRGVKKFLGLTALIALTSGAAVWLFERGDAVTVGASGLIYGYFGYVVLRGLFDRRLIDSLVGVVMGASYAYLLTNAMPGAPGISWLAHLGGLVGGLLGAWLFRDRGTRRAAAAPAPAPPTGSPSSNAALLKELDDLGL